MVFPTGSPKCLTPRTQQSPGGPARTGDSIEVMGQLVGDNPGLSIIINQFDDIYTKKQVSPTLFFSQKQLLAVDRTDLMVKQI